jgi:hypothetical protein
MDTSGDRRVDAMSTLPDELVIAYDIDGVRCDACDDTSSNTDPVTSTTCKQ